MAKRFTDTAIWDEDWFIALPKDYRELWFYIKDKCDHAGIWRPNIATFNKLFDCSAEGKKALELFNKDKERIIIIKGGRWFLPQFIPFQYGLHLKYCDNSIILGNNVDENHFYGIYLGETDNNTIAGNSIKENHIGIYLEFSNYNNDLSLRLYIGPGPQDYRERLFNVCEKAPSIFKLMERRRGTKWHAVYQKKFLERKDFDSISIEESSETPDIMSKISKKWDEFVNNDLGKIDDHFKENWS